MTAFITLTHRSVEHTDPDAAGFVDGWWWTVTDDHGYFESASPTRESSEEFARACASAHGHDDVKVVVREKLMNRAADEARVQKLIASDT